jgi:hypothetical protein
MIRYIEKKRVIDISSRLEGFMNGAKIRVVIEANESVRERLTRLEWTDRPATGESFLPAPIGPVSRFNALGGWKKHRNQPKETRYLFTILHRWQTWAGRDRIDHEEQTDHYRLCYPREQILPPSMELTFIEKGGKEWIASRSFRNVPEEYERIRHAINLFLELFGSCELTGFDMTETGDIPLRHVNWRLLPPGEHPWESLEEHLKIMLNMKHERYTSVILDRQETIRSFGPTEIHVGAGGFREYLAYLFPDRGLVILESIQHNNAIYVFGQDWHKVSRLSKAEVISGNHQFARIVHSKGWKGHLARILHQSDAAE